MSSSGEKSTRMEPPGDEGRMKSVKSLPNRVMNRIYPLGFTDEVVFICRNAIPLAIGNLSQMLFTMMSLFFCGHVGANELAAVALANTFINVGCIAPLNGMATACDTLFPKLFGGSDKKKVGVILQKGWIISILTAMPCVSVLLNAKNLMFLISKEEQVIRLADEFLLYYSPSAFFYSIYIVLSKYLQSQNIIMPVLLISVVSNMINAGMQALFVFWLKTGVKGSAVAVAVANGCQVLLLVGFIVVKKVYKQTWPGWSIECLYDWKIYLKYGLGGVGMTVFEWAFFEIAVISTSVLSSTDISVMSITLQIMFLVSMVYTGIAYSGNIRIGYLLGENQPKEAVNTVKVVMTLGFLSSLVISILIFGLSNEFALLFTNEEKVVSMSNPIVKFMAVSCLLDALQAYGNAVLRTVGAQSFGMIISFICYYILGLPIGFFLLFKTKLRVLGFWMGHSAIAIILFVLQIIYISRVDWVRKAQRAHNLCLKKNHRKSDKQTTISLAVLSGSALTKLESVNTVNTDLVQVVDVEAGVVVSQSIETKPNLKKKLAKKTLLFTFFVLIFSASFLVKDIYDIRASSMAGLNRPMFSNWTFLASSSYKNATMHQ